MQIQLSHSQEHVNIYAGVKEFFFHRNLYQNIHVLIVL